MSSKHYAAADILRKLVEGNKNNIADIISAGLKDDYQNILSKVVVLEIIYDPSLLDEKRIEDISTLIAPHKDIHLKNLPLNSIIGQRVRGGSNVSDTPEIFFPFLPPFLSMPLKAGEHCWILYDDIANVNRQGYYLWRINELRNTDDLNYTHSDRKFESQSQSLSDKAAGKAKQAPGFANGAKTADGEHLADSASILGDENIYKKLLTETDAAAAVDYEKVPRYKKRPDENILQGSNNTLIRLGTDRTGHAAKKGNKKDGSLGALGKPDKDLKGNSGIIELIVGRTGGKSITNELGRQEIDKSLDKEDENEGDFDLENDAGRFFISMKTNVDENFNIKIKNLKDTSGKEKSVGLLKCDQIRLLAREDIKIIMQPKGSASEDECGSIVLNKKGDVIFTPAKNGVLKLGGDDATNSILMQENAVDNNGTVISKNLVSSMGGALGTGGITGVFSKKVLIK